MKRSVLKRSLCMLLCGAVLSGCGMASGDNQNKGMDAGAKNEKDAGTGFSSEMDELIGNADVQGGVAEFTEGGCTIVPIFSDENTAQSAAPDYWDETEKIDIVYKEGMEVQTAVYQMGTGETTLSQASIADIKKETSILVYGEKQDSGAYLAHKIVIRRIEGAADSVKGVD